MKILVNDYTKAENIKIINLDKELEEAHKNKMEEKLTSLYRLQQIEDNENIPTIYRNWCKDIIIFIKENA